ncbi:hypothetical protein KSF78_0005735 [Schistosoma japonicum]|nr:hypothetical protein KSF78_0005735 [Schistosoma japonicum]
MKSSDLLTERVYRFNNDNNLVRKEEIHFGRMHLINFLVQIILNEEEEEEEINLFKWLLTNYRKYLPVYITVYSLQFFFSNDQVINNFNL